MSWLELMPLSIDTITDRPEHRVAPGAEDHAGHRPRGEWLPRQHRHRQHEEQRKIEEQIDGDDGQHAADQRARNVPAGLLDFLGEVDRRRPAVVACRSPTAATGRTRRRAPDRQAESTRPPATVAAPPSRNAAAASETNASALSALVTFWIALPHRMPRHWASVNTTTTNRGNRRCTVAEHRERAPPRTRRPPDRRQPSNRRSRSSRSSRR